MTSELTIEIENVSLELIDLVTGRSLKWWHVPDDGGWPRHWTRPSLYGDDVVATRPRARPWANDNNWRLRPHP